MIKTIPLLIASFKGFIRNWKSVLLLIVVPLILISTIFATFNPLGIQKTPVGLVLQNESMQLDDINDYVSSFLIITEYKDLDDCFKELKQYKQYVCFVISKEYAIVLDVHFDNTRTPIIWEILAQIKGAIDYLQKQKSKEIAERFIGDFKKSVGDAKELKAKITLTHSKIDEYIQKIDNAIYNLENSKNNLKSNADFMDSYVNLAKNDKNSIEFQKNRLISETKSTLSTVQYLLSSIPITQENAVIVSQAQSDLFNINNDLDAYSYDFNNIYSRIGATFNNYDSASSKIDSNLINIDFYIKKLHDIKSELEFYKTQLNSADGDVSQLIKQLDILLSLDAETLVNPIIIRNNPVYIPEVNKELVDRFSNRFNDLSEIEKVMAGLNLLNLQTIYPLLLLMITLFLSLLVSNFMCLNQINSPANTRVKLVEGIFLHDFIAIYLSSLVIIIIPIFIVLLLGNFLFLLKVFRNLHLVLLVLFLVVSIFIFFGMTLAYLIKKDSITLLISTFVLVFLLFFSGFMLPIERMTNSAANIANQFPGKLAFTSLNKVLFYNQHIPTIYSELWVLSIWYIGLLSLTLFIKKIRNA